MWAEVRTLLWLQLRLTRAIFRSRRGDALARIGQLALGLLVTLMSLPFFTFWGAAMGWLVAKLDPMAAFEAMVLSNLVLLGLAMVTPATYDSNLLERFDVTRLFVHPVSETGLIVGTTLVSLFSPVGLGTTMVIAGQVIGLTWRAPLGLPLYFIGALALFAIVTFTSRLMDDVLDLVASDRRLRTALLFIMASPFILLAMSSLLFQFIGQTSSQALDFLNRYLPTMPDLRGMGFLEGFSAIALWAGPSRFLFWLPTTWASGAMIFTVAGLWGRWALHFVTSILAAAALLWGHSTILQQLMRGASVRLAGQTVRSPQWPMRLPLTQQLRALITKDWTYLLRNPYVRTMLISTPIVMVSFAAAFIGIRYSSPAGDIAGRFLAPVLAALITIAVNTGTSNLAGNYFGTVDREGLVTLTLAPVLGRKVLLSANLVCLALAIAQSAVYLLVGAIIAREPLVFLGGLLFALVLNVSTLPFYNLSSIFAPKREQTDNVMGSNTSSTWVAVAWLLATPPVTLLVALPYAFLPQALWITVPIAIVYAFGLYALTLGPLGRQLELRFGRVYEAVTKKA